MAIKQRQEVKRLLDNGKLLAIKVEQSTQSAIAELHKLGYRNILDSKIDTKLLEDK